MAQGVKNPPGRTAKPCTVCGVVKPLAEFYVSNKSSDGRHSDCKLCAAERVRISRASGRRNPAADQATATARRRLNAEAVWRYLLTHPCVDCGEADPVVLEFDHVYGEKIAPIARMVNNRRWAVIAAEIDKCVVRCANCHRRKTAAAAGWYAYLGQDHRAVAAQLRAELTIPANQQGESQHGPCQAQVRPLELGGR